LNATSSCVTLPAPDGRRSSEPEISTSVEKFVEIRRFSPHVVTGPLFFRRFGEAKAEIRPEKCSSFHDLLVLLL
jgi:hypothetical protein